MSSSFEESESGSTSNEPGRTQKIGSVGFLCPSCGKCFLNETTFDNHLQNHNRGRKKLKGVRTPRPNTNHRKNIAFKCSTSIHKMIRVHKFKSEFKHKSEVKRKLQFASVCSKRIKLLSESFTESQNCIPQARLSSSLYSGQVDPTPCNQNCITLKSVKSDLRDYDSPVPELPEERMDTDSFRPDVRMDDQPAPDLRMNDDPPAPDLRIGDDPRAPDLRIDDDPPVPDMMENIAKFAEQNTQLLFDLIQAIGIEKSKCDIKKFGSLFENLSQSLINGALTPDQLCFKIAASMARLKNTQSNRMVYSDAEYEFWEYINYLHGESTLRDLTGKKGFGLEKEGEIGTQNPEDLEINIPIPSRQERTKNIKWRPVVMKPGVIKESLDILNHEPHLKNLNLSIDEKHLSTGVQLTVKEDTIKIDGDQEYIGKATTNKEIDIENLRRGLNMLDVLENTTNLEQMETSDSTSTASALLEISSLLVNYESSLKSKLLESSSSLTKLRSKTRKNLVNIAREVSEVSKVEKCLSELNDLKVTLSDTMLEAFVKEEAFVQLNVLRNYDTLVDSEDADDKNVVKSLSGDMMYVSTRSNFWKQNINLACTIPTKEIGDVTGLNTLKCANQKLRCYFKAQDIPLDNLNNCEMYYETLPLFSQALFMLNNSLEIYETGTLVVNVNNVLKVASVGGSIMRNRTTDMLECVHIFSSSVDANSCLDIIVRMKLFNTEIGAITFLDEENNLMLATVETCSTLDNIWNLCLKILVDVSENPVARRISDETKELKKLLKQDNLNSLFKVITLFPVNNVNKAMDLKFDPGSVFASPVVKITQKSDFQVELDNFVIKCKEAFKTSTILIRPAAGQLLLFSINNIEGRRTVSDRDDLITHYSRTGRGTQISRDVRPQIEAAIEDIENHTDARVVSFSADTAYHNLIDYTDEGEIKNIVCLQYETYKQCKNNKPKKNLEIICDSIRETPLNQLDIPLTWTDKKKGEVKKPSFKLFPNLGDRAMEIEMKKLDYPLNPLFKLPSISESLSDKEIEHADSDNESEPEILETETPSQTDLPFYKTKSSIILSLKKSAEKILLSNTNLLVNVAAQIMFSKNYEEYKTRVPISEQLILPGNSEPLDIISAPEVSKIKGHLRGSFIDVTHNGTRLRSNATSRDVIMGSSSAYHYVAVEGMTSLKVTHVEDRCDMMSEDICRVRYELIYKKKSQK